MQAFKHVLNVAGCEVVNDFFVVAVLVWPPVGFRSCVKPARLKYASISLLLGIALYDFAVQREVDVTG